MTFKKVYFRIWQKGLFQPRTKRSVPEYDIQKGLF
jgi:hypothetical protein